MVINQGQVVLQISFTYGLTTGTWIKSEASQGLKCQVV